MNAPRLRPDDTGLRRPGRGGRKALKMNKGISVHARVLDPGQSQSTQVTAVLYDGVDQVTELTPDGRVR